MSDYHVALELTPEQVRGLKLLAVGKGVSIKNLISQLTIEAIEKNNKKEEKQ